MASTVKTMKIPAQFTPGQMGMAGTEMKKLLENCNEEMKALDKPKKPSKRPSKRVPKENKGNTPSRIKAFAIKHGLHWKEDDYLGTDDKFSFLQPVSRRVQFKPEEWDTIVKALIVSAALTAENHKDFGIDDAETILSVSAEARAILAKELGKGVAPDDLYVSKMSCDFGRGNFTIQVMHKAFYHRETNTTVMALYDLSPNKDLILSIAKKKSMGGQTIGIHDHFHAKALVSVFCPN